MTNITAVHMELTAACYKDVNRLLFEFVEAATLDTTTEDNLLHISDQWWSNGLMDNGSSLNVLLQILPDREGNEEKS